jgi:predicted transcriptional regulator
MGTFIIRKETYWIKYLIALKGTTLTDISNYARCTPSMVSQVLHGRKQSARVKKIIAETLGYDSFANLVVDCEKLGGIA